MTLTIEQIARVCHEANRAYCMAIGDHSQASWDRATAWQKDSAITGVTASLAAPDKTPEQSHQGWLEKKAAEGWTYGAVKKPELRQHPCMVPYDQLPIEQRLKDELFIGVVRALGGVKTVTDAELVKAVELHEAAAIEPPRKGKTKRSA